MRIAVNRLCNNFVCPRLIDAAPWLLCAMFVFMAACYTGHLVAIHKFDELYGDKALPVLLFLAAVSGTSRVREYIAARLPFLSNKPLITMVGALRAHHFDRADVQQILRAKLKETGIVKLFGLSGVGKTELGLEHLAFRSKQGFSTIIISARTREDGVRDLSQFCLLAGLPSERDGDSFAQLRNWLARHDRWCLLIDDLGDEQELLRLVPPSPQGEVILTSLNPSATLSAALVPIDPLPTELAQQFLKNAIDFSSTSYGSDSEEELALVALSNELGGLPLALSQAAGLMQESAGLLKPSDVLRMYKRERSALLIERATQADDRHPESVCTTFGLLFERLRQDNNRALSLLELLACIGLGTISSELFKRGVRILNDFVQVDDNESVGSFLNTLHSFSLIQISDQAIFMHSIVRDLIIESLRDEQRRLLTLTAARLLKEIESTAPDNESGHRTTFQLLPQTMAVAEVICDLNIEEEEAIAFVLDAGLYALRSSIFEQAEQLLFWVITSTDKIDALDLRDKARFNIALVQCATGKMLEAKNEFESLLQEELTSLPEDDPSLFHLWTNLGSLYRDLSVFVDSTTDYRELGLEMHQKALATFGTSVTKDRHYGMALLSVALANCDCGNMEAAQLYLERAKTVLAEHCLPAAHETALLYDAEASILLRISQDNAPAAEELILHSLSIKQELLRDGHIEIGIARKELGRLYLNMRRFEEAEMCLNQALQIFRGIWPPRQNRTAEVLLLLSVAACRLRGQRAGGLVAVYAEEAVECLDSYKQWTAFYSTRVREIAQVLEEAGNYEQALKIHEQVFEFMKSRMPENIADLSLSASAIANCLHALGREQEAENLDFQTETSQITET